MKMKKKIWLACPSSSVDLRTKHTIKLRMENRVSSKPAGLRVVEFEKQRFLSTSSSWCSAPEYPQYWLEFYLFLSLFANLIVLSRLCVFSLAFLSAASFGTAQMGLAFSIVQKQHGGILKSGLCLTVTHPPFLSVLAI
jgi:hypothetical protein